MLSYIKGSDFMAEDGYLHFCGGEKLKNREITIILTPDVNFRLELLAKENNLPMENFIFSVLREYTENKFPKKINIPDLFK